MDDGPRYHHGNLRTSLLDAADAELRETGLESFSLRRVARRAGVSHAAPAHHFRDANGLLTALAARGYDRLLRLADIRLGAVEGGGARAALDAYGLAYADFAREHAPLFRLCFASDRPDFADATLKVASDAAFDRLARLVGHIRGAPPYGDLDGMTDAFAAWSMIHGLADLLSAGRMAPLATVPPEERDRRIVAMLARAVDVACGGGTGQGEGRG